VTVARDTRLAREAEELQVPSSVVASGAPKYRCVNLRAREELRGVVFVIAADSSRSRPLATHQEV